MNLLKLLKNETGMTMVNVLMGAAMMGGLALVMTQLGKNSSDIQKRATNSSEINEAYNRAQQYLLNSESCKETFTGKALPLNTEIPLDHIITSHNSLNIPKFIVSKKIGKSSRVIMNSIIAKRTSGNHIEIKFNFNRGTAVKTNIISKTVEVTSNIDGSNNVLKCFSQLDNAVADACSSIGGTLNGATCENSILHQEIDRLELMICKFRIEDAISSGVTTNIPECNKKVIFKEQLVASNGNFALPSSYVEGSLEAWIIGGGGGGGCGGGSKGAGGRKGSSKHITKTNFASAKSGNTITYQIGGGGDSRACHSGGTGGTTKIKLKTNPWFSAGGGGGGDKKCGGNCWSGNGENVIGFSAKFYNWYGGTYHENQQGEGGGGYGTGGAGGEKTTADKRSGGNGSKGAVYFQYVYTDNI